MIGRGAFVAAASCLLAASLDARADTPSAPTFGDLVEVPAGRVDSCAAYALEDKRLLAEHAAPPSPSGRSYDYAACAHALVPSVRKELCKGAKPGEAKLWLMRSGADHGAIALPLFCTK